MQPLRILYTGACRRGSLTDLRRKALIELGHEVTVLDQAPYLDSGPTLMRKVHSHLLVGPGTRAYRRDLIALAEKERHELVYVDQGLYLTADDVVRLHAAARCVVHYTSEYFGYRPYQFRRLLDAANQYDVHVITNRLNVERLRLRGAGKIILTEFGYDPDLHRPADSPDPRRYTSDVVFVGHWEPAYEAAIGALRSAGIDVHVWGPGWSKAATLGDRHEIKPVRGEQYVAILSGARICLGLLSRWNRNESASRTFEIPAVGSLLLAQRTVAHQSYFEDGREAVFFSSHEELIEQARFFLEHEDERRLVAAAGHERCGSSGFTHLDRMRDVVNRIVNASSVLSQKFT